MNSKNEKQFHKIWRIVRNVLQSPKTMANGINYQLSDEPFILSSSNVLIGGVNPPPHPMSLKLQESWSKSRPC